MGRIGAKGKKLSVTNQDDSDVMSEKVKVPPQKRRGRPQKSLKDEIDDQDEAQKMEDEQSEDTNGVPNKDVKNRNGKKRKRNIAQVKQKVDSVEGDENGNATKSSTESSNGLLQNRNRRKNKPSRAPEAIVECN